MRPNFDHKFVRTIGIFHKYLQKLTKNGEDWGKLIVAKAFKKLPKVQHIAQSGHTAHKGNVFWNGQAVLMCISKLVKQEVSRTVCDLFPSLIVSVNRLFLKNDLNVAISSYEN